MERGWRGTGEGTEGGGGGAERVAKRGGWMQGGRGPGGWRLDGAGATTREWGRERAEAKIGRRRREGARAITERWRRSGSFLRQGCS